MGSIPKRMPTETFAGQLICNKDQKSPPFWVYNRYNNQVYFSSYHISPQTVKTLHQGLTQVQVDLPHGVYLFDL